MAIKFNQHSVTDGATSARVIYSAYSDRDGASWIALYAKGFDDGDALARIFGDVYKNDSDIHSDYFDKGSVKLGASHELYADALAASQAREASRTARKQAKAERAAQPLSTSAVEITSRTAREYEHSVADDFDVVSSGERVFVHVSTYKTARGPRQSWSIATSRTRRGGGKTFWSLEQAQQSYRDRKILAALAAVGAALNAPSDTTDCVEVQS